MDFKARVEEFLKRLEANKKELNINMFPEIVLSQGKVESNLKLIDTDDGAKSKSNPTA